MLSPAASKGRITYQGTSQAHWFLGLSWGWIVPFDAVIGEIDRSIERLHEACLVEMEGLTHVLSEYTHG